MSNVTTLSVPLVRTQQIHALLPVDLIVICVIQTLIAKIVKLNISKIVEIVVHVIILNVPLVRLIVLSVFKLVIVLVKLAILPKNVLRVNQENL